MLTLLYIPYTNNTGHLRVVSGLDDSIVGAGRGAGLGCDDAIAGLHGKGVSAIVLNIEVVSDDLSLLTGAGTVAGLGGGGGHGGQDGEDHLQQ